MTVVTGLGARPLTTVGVALLGAGAIAVSPVAPPMPGALRVASPDVALTQLPSWITEGAANIAAQVGDIGGLLGSEIANPLPILNTVVHNQIFNALGLGSALVDSGTTLVQGLVLAPVAVANAIVAAIENPTQIPAILAQLSETFIDLAAGVVTPVVGTLTDIATTTVDRAIGVVTAVVANTVPILNSFVNIPVAIGTQLLASGSAVIAALATLNPITVINAVGQGFVDVEETTFDAFAGVVNAFGDLRGDVLDALDSPVVPAPLASVTAPAGESTLRTAAAVNTLEVGPAAAKAPVSAPDRPDTAPGKVAVGAAQEVQDAAKSGLGGGAVADIAQGIGSAVKQAVPGSSAAKHSESGGSADAGAPAGSGSQAGATKGKSATSGGTAKSHRAPADSGRADE